MPRFSRRLSSWSSRGRLAAALAAALIACGCHSASPGQGRSGSPPSSSTANPGRLCAEVHGTWDASAGRCKVALNDPSGAHVEATASYPVDLVDNPTAGPTLSEFVRKFFVDYGESAPFGSGNANLTSKVFTHGSATKSIVFQSDWYFSSMPHPNAQITTFTFDLDQHKQIRLTDLLCPGLDPVKAIPPLARPIVAQALSGSPFSVEQFEPDHPEGQLADSYQAWALDSDDLVLYLPAERGPGGIPPGYITPRIPLTALSPILREKGCSTATTTPAR